MIEIMKELIREIFDEKFPSLVNSYVDENDRIHKLSIVNHCTDKAVLKETITRICLQTGAEITKSHLFIELELEEQTSCSECGGK